MGKVQKLYEAYQNKYMGRLDELKGSMARAIEGAECKQGTVYALKNPCIPDLLKIGVTLNVVHERVRNMNTAYPINFAIVDYRLFHHAAIVEMVIHRFFNDDRVNKGREFFRIHEHEVKAALAACHEVDGVDLGAVIDRM